MKETGTLILTNHQIEQKINRMAYQVYEHNSEETEIVLAGIMNSGYEFAKKIKTVLEEISPITVTLIQVSLNKKAPLSGVESSVSTADCHDKVVVIVDDVLNSGATLMYVAKHFLAVPLKKLQTLVLVDRSHKSYPIKADFKGISLSTSLNETVQVSFGEQARVDLF